MPISALKERIDRVDRTPPVRDNPRMADTLIRNARIWTGDAARPWATAAVIRDGRFAFVGEEQAANTAPGTTVIDARGRLLLPGFVDAHAHLLDTGMARRWVDLKSTLSVDDAVRRVAGRVAASAFGAWVRGVGWDQNDWPGAHFPHRRALDAVSPENPVVLSHTSGHCVWVNSAALRAAGITAATPAPVGGAIDLDEEGDPSGILRDTASRLISKVAPPATQGERIAAMQDAIAHAHSLGITGVHAMDVGRGEFQALHALNDSSALTLRVHEFLSASRLDEWFERNFATGDGDAMLAVGGVKFFSDGALGSLTAWMCEPYAGSSDVGFPLQPIADLERDVRRCLEHGLAPAIHAIGDRANHEVLDLLERAREVAPGLPRRIEHAQLLAAGDCERFGALGITASVQPIHATQDMAKVDRSWGDRGTYAYAFVSLLASGANLAFGSDTPVETMDPIAGIHAAVTRRNAAGHPPGGWYPAQRVTIDAAVTAYTSGVARAAGIDDTRGRIAPGYDADAVMLSHDIFALTDPMRILDARADITLVAGNIVRSREDA